MNGQPAWKILIYLCGDAGDRLTPEASREGVDLAWLLRRPPASMAAVDAYVLVQGIDQDTRQALRLAQQPGERLAQLVEVAEEASDSPATRDDFAAWAMARYPSDHTLLLLGDCKTPVEQLQPPPGTAFQLIDSPDGPAQRPLSPETLAALVEEGTASRSTLRQWLQDLLSSVLGQSPQPTPDLPPNEPATQPEEPQEEQPMDPKRKWTILIYMAGDNGKTFETKFGNYALMGEMTTAGYKDIAELQLAGGTTDQVAVLVQFDTNGTDHVQKGSYRLEIGPNANQWSDHIVETIPESNTGDPAELARFIVWGMNRYPAQNTLLVLWNHGLGWKDDDVYQSVRSISRSVRSGRPGRGRNAAAFLSTAREIQERAEQEGDDETRGILCDDSSMDFLTNVEMSQALRAAEVAQDEADVTALFGDQARLQAAMADLKTGTRRRLNVLGMDACLMAMIEVNYQVRDFADVMVASQEVEPMNGWPYTPIVTQLNARPEMTPQALGTLIVEEYAKSYEGSRSSNVTQAAIDLGKMEETGARIQAFAQAVNQSYAGDDDLQFAYSRAARANRRTFEDREYLDLAAFTASLLDFYGASGSPVHAAGQALLDWLNQETGGPVVKNVATGKYEGKASGLSIYVAEDLPSPLYKEIDFQRTGWLGLLETVHQTI